MLYIATKASVLQYDFSVLMCFQAVCCILFVPILRFDGGILCFSYSGILYSLENTQNILFSFPSNLSCLYLSFHASRNLCVFLVRAGVSDAVLISLSSVDCFPSKKDHSEPCTCFPFDLIWLTF